MPRVSVPQIIKKLYRDLNIYIAPLLKPSSIKPQKTRLEPTERTAANTPRR